jgi:hypothetical protein
MVICIQAAIDNEYFQIKPTPLRGYMYLHEIHSYSFQHPLKGVKNKK